MDKTGFEKEKHFYKIGELAAKAEVTVRTLRYYEELGLLSPAEVSPGGFRLYTEGDLGRVGLIKRFKEVGFSLEDIQKLLDTTDFGETKQKRVEASVSLLEKQLQQIEGKMAGLQRSKENIEEALEALKTCKKCSHSKCPSKCSNRKVIL